jgi:hypothetical protein
MCFGVYICIFTLCFMFIAALDIKTRDVPTVSSVNSLLSQYCKASLFFFFNGVGAKAGPGHHQTCRRRGCNRPAMSSRLHSLISGSIFSWCGECGMVFGLWGIVSGFYVQELVWRSVSLLVSLSHILKSNYNTFLFPLFYIFYLVHYCLSGCKFALEHLKNN